MPNYTGFEPQRPFGSFIAGMGAADQMQHSALKNESMQAALDMQKRQQETAKQFAATGDPRELRGYDPALATDIENKLATMDFNKQKFAVERLGAGIDLTEKMLPYIVAASKSNPAAAANMWPEYVTNLGKVGIQLPPFLQQYSPEALESVLKYKEDLKTAVARITAASRERTAAGSQAAQIYSADRGYEGRIGAAQIGATRPRGGASSNRFTNYTDYKADVRAGKIPGIPPNADEDTIIRGFNAANTGGKAAGAAEYPKPLKPMDQMMEDTMYPGGRPGTGSKQPGASPKRQYLLPSKADPSKMIPATEEQYKAWHGIK
jgi:hypothetical protein